MLSRHTFNPPPPQNWARVARCVETVVGRNRAFIVCVHACVSMHVHACVCVMESGCVG